MPVFRESIKLFFINRHNPVRPALSPPCMLVVDRNMYLTVLPIFRIPAGLFPINDAGDLS